MQQLSGLDASFLHLETAEMPMHVGAAHVLELPPGYRGNWTAQLRRHLRERLPAMPALTRKLVAMPLNLANPAWVDCEVDMDYHVTEVRCPSPAATRPSRKSWPGCMRSRWIAADRCGSSPWSKGLHPARSGCSPACITPGSMARRRSRSPRSSSIPARSRARPRPRRRRRQYRLGLGEMLGGMLSNQVSQIEPVAAQRARSGPCRDGQPAREVRRDHRPAA
jgi:diacylglycerol O-acyltransferase